MIDLLLSVKGAFSSQCGTSADTNFVTQSLDITQSSASQGASSSNFGKQFCFVANRVNGFVAVDIFDLNQD